MKKELITVVLGIIGFIMACIMCEFWSSLYYYTALGDVLAHWLYTVLGYSILIGSFSTPFHVYYNLIK